MDQEWVRYLTVDLPRAIEAQTYAVADLPAAAGLTNTRAFVTDATSTTFAAIVAGGGSNRVPIYSDGTDWRIG
jgi:hypothetical protein